MGRKIVQINTVQVFDRVVNYCLCDDGTLWRKYGDADWVLVPTNIVTNSLVGEDI